MYRWLWLWVLVGLLQISSIQSYDNDKEWISTIYSLPNTEDWPRLIQEFQKTYTPFAPTPFRTFEDEIPRLEVTCRTISDLMYRLSKHARLFTLDHSIEISLGEFTPLEHLAYFEKTYYTKSPKKRLSMLSKWNFYLGGDVTPAPLCRSQLTRRDRFQPETIPLEYTTFQETQRNILLAMERKYWLVEIQLLVSFYMFQEMEYFWKVYNRPPPSEYIPDIHGILHELKLWYEERFSGFVKRILKSNKLKEDMNTLLDGGDSQDRSSVWFKLVTHADVYGCRYPRFIQSVFEDVASSLTEIQKTLGGIVDKNPRWPTADTINIIGFISKVRHHFFLYEDLARSASNTMVDSEATRNEGYQLCNEHQTQIELNDTWHMWKVWAGIEPRWQENEYYGY